MSSHHKYTYINVFCLQYLYNTINTHVLHIILIYYDSNIIQLDISSQKVCKPIKINIVIGDVSKN